MSGKLNWRQRELLALVAKARTMGCIVYGRGYAESIEALERRGMVARMPGRSVLVATMGKIETRRCWQATQAGLAALRDGACQDCGEEGERVGHQTCQYPQDAALDGGR